MTTQLVIFDLEGTTVTGEKNMAAAYKKAFALNDIAIEKEIVEPLLAFHKPKTIQMVLEYTGHSFDPGFINDIQEDFESVMLEFYDADVSVRPIPGTEEIFRWLKEKNILVALNTGFSAAIAHAIVSRFQWEDNGLVDEYLGSDEVEEGRPSPYMIRELMKRCRITDPGVVAKVGDEPIDIEEGLNAGCGHVIGITTGLATAAELVKSNPTHLIYTLSQLKGIF